MPALRDMPAEGIELVKHFEGIDDGDKSTPNIDAYLDPVGIWTIGWGHALKVGGEFLRGAANTAQARAMYPGGLTTEQCHALLLADLLQSCGAVTRLVTVQLSDGQYGALVSFAFNAGGGNLAASTLLKKLNAGDYAGAADQFLVWDKARVNGVLQPMAGLARRRRTERALFLGEDWRAASAVRSRGAVSMTLESSRPDAPEGEGDATWRDEGSPAKVAKKVKKAPARKAAVKKAAVKKAAVKKAAVKKAVAKKAPVKKAASKKTAPKKDAPKKDAPKKAVLKKAPAKKAAKRR